MEGPRIAAAEFGRSISREIFPSTPFPFSVALRTHSGSAVIPSVSAIAEIPKCPSRFDGALSIDQPTPEGPNEFSSLARWVLFSTKAGRRSNHRLNRRSELSSCQSPTRWFWVVKKPLISAFVCRRIHSATLPVKDLLSFAVDL
jgi:hypothetical protein